jgi:hypothetical protein
MAESLLRKLVRNVSENGPKLLLENYGNVRDLLVLLHEPQVNAIDFPAMTVERTHFVQPDYAHVALDLLLKAPFRVSAGGPPRTIFIYLLVEHQSRPQRFCILRLAEYVLEAYKMQKRAWEVYHVRGVDEQPELRNLVDRSVQTDPHRKEYTKMGQTIAEMYIEKGRVEGEQKGRVEGEQKGALEMARATLLRQLGKRFKKVPRKVEANVMATTKMESLKSWLDNVLDAKTLAEVGIPVD